MAELTVKDVKTFVAELPALSLEEIVKTKFQGRKTTKTLAAARRIQAKKRSIKVPANLLKQLFIVTGGWSKPLEKSGWRGHKPEADAKTVAIGDLAIVISLRDGRDYYASMFISYRGHAVFMLGYSGEPWKDSEQALKSLRALI